MNNKYFILELNHAELGLLSSMLKGYSQVLVDQGTEEEFDKLSKVITSLAMKMNMAADKR